MPHTRSPHCSELWFLQANWDHFTWVLESSEHYSCHIFGFKTCPCFNWHRLIEGRWQQAYHASPSSLYSACGRADLPSSEPKPNWNRFIFQSYFLDPLETGYKSLEAQDPRLKLIASQHYLSHPYSLLAEGLPHSPRFGSAAAQTPV